MAERQDDLDPQKLIERYRRAKERRSPWEGHWRGGFKLMAETWHRPAARKADMKRTVEKDVQPLFGARKPKVAAETLQSSLNDLNDEAAAKRSAPKPEPLKLDGDIGPKTEGAFASALADHGAETVTKRYSDDLGFGFG